MPQVTTEIVAMLPAEGPIQNLWVERPPTTAAAGVPPTELARTAAGLRGRWREMSGNRWLTLLLAIAASAFFVTRRPAFSSIRS
jgi:hypothetical protein